MCGHWLSMKEVAAVLQRCTADNVDLILELRELIRQVAPEVTEAVKFHSLCYFKPGRPFGSIGGHVCGIGEQKGTVYLNFIHGAALPDPDGLLQGKAKAMRKIAVHSPEDIHRPAVKKLIRASVNYDATRCGRTDA